MARQTDLAARLRTGSPVERGAFELLATAVIVFALTFPLVNFETFDRNGVLVFDTRWLAMGMAVLLAVLGRLSLILYRHRQYTAVLVGCLIYSVYYIGLMVGQWLGDAETAAFLEALIPFDAHLVVQITVIFALIVAIRAALAMRRAGDVRSVEDREAAMDRFGARVQKIALYLGPAFAIFALTMPLFGFADRYIVSLGITIMIYIMLGWGLNIVVGLAGLLDLGYVAFYAVGAYSYALIATTPGLELSFWLCLPLAGLMAATAGILLGFPVLRLRGDYLAIVTLGFGEMIRIILQNWVSFTGGADGISRITRPDFFGIADFVRRPEEGMPAFHEMFGIDYSPLHKIVFMYYLIVVLALVTNFFALRIRRLPIGRAWEALREDEIACNALGINPTNTKLTAFSIGAMFAGFGGSFFAAKQGFIAPENFTFIESAIILAIVVLGGFGSQMGVVFAAFLLIGLPELGREFDQFRMLFFGGAMVLIMLWRPKGLLAHREPTIRLSERKFDETVATYDTREAKA